MIRQARPPRVALRAIRALSDLSDRPAAERPVTAAVAHPPVAPAEIAGCFAVRAGWRQDAAALWLIPGMAAPAASGWLPARVDTIAAGRAFAGHGGVCIAASLAWMWRVQGLRPDRRDTGRRHDPPDRGHDHPGRPARRLGVRPPPAPADTGPLHGPGAPHVSCRTTWKGKQCPPTPRSIPPVPPPRAARDGWASR